MIRLDEAQDIFRRASCDNTAHLYHRVAWREYLDGKIKEEVLREVIRETDKFWGVPAHVSGV